MENKPPGIPLSEWIEYQFWKNQKKKKRKRRKKIPKIGYVLHSQQPRKRLRPIRYRTGRYRRIPSGKQQNYKKLYEEIQKIREHLKKEKTSSGTPTGKFEEKLKPIIPDPQRLAAIAAVQSDIINRAFSRDPLATDKLALTYKDLQQDKRISEAEKAAKEAREESKRLLDMVSASVIPQQLPPAESGKEEESPPASPQQKPKLTRKGSVVDIASNINQSVAQQMLQSAADKLRYKFTAGISDTSSSIYHRIAKLAAPDELSKLGKKGAALSRDELTDILKAKNVASINEFINNSEKAMKSRSDKEKIKLAEEYAKLNNKTLPEYTKMIGKGEKTDKSGGLSNIEIQNIVDKLSSVIPPESFRGVYAADEIDNIEPSLSPFSYIMNLDKSGKPGTHWIAVYVDPVKEMSAEYFDSFGDPPGKDWLIRMKKMIDKLKLPYMLKMKINTVINQRANSESCGWFAVKFLKDRYMGKPFYDASGYKDAVCQPIVMKMEKKINEMKGGFGYV